MPAPISFSNIAFTGNPIIRDSEKRSDDCVELALKTAESLIILFVNGLVVQKEDTPLLALDEVQQFDPDWKSAVYLGQYRGRSVLAAHSDIQIDDLTEPFIASNLRGLYADTKIAAPFVGALAQASSLLNWHDNNGFCARCGGETVMRGGGNRRSCSSCGAEHFPRVDPIAIMLVTRRDKCLLAHNHNFTEKRYSCLAGFVEQGETFEAAVRREVFEEVRVKIGEVTYIASQPWPFPQALMLGSFADALNDDIFIDDSEIASAQWFDRAEVNSMLLEKHPQGFNLPPIGSIASYLIRRWLHKFTKGKV
ncbi:NAD(+) diphosphatase [Bartonella sp. HY329]|uniref:NAD(+) diphosphatase n=1 Tax=unclassified Bartonella TaxID=2645622 RepID=UPI0021C5D4E1|nr:MULTISPECIES: NAD(+) diphosphatase [unclassified Bartonella]UXM95338.1 NAD(+) diphosphatase [Bartonella sp. HY329]UXN09663.1 NAD(+) diphosphatase [Bartonella sp. HY328]